MDCETPETPCSEWDKAIVTAAMELLESRLALPQEIDTALKYTLGIWLPVVGIVESWDFMGLDAALAISRSLNLTCAIIAEKVAAGHLGVKTGKRMYDYGDCGESDVSRKRDQTLLKVPDHLKLTNAFEPI